MFEKLYGKATVEMAEGKMLAVATDESIDRHGESLPIEAWDLRAFKKNPVLMYSHDYNIPPIGLAKNIKIDGKRMLFEPVFHGLTMLSQEIATLYKEGIMSKFSVGFIPHRDDKEEKLRLELLEISAVSIPANPHATVLEKALTSEISSEDKVKLEVWLKSFNEPEVKESHTEVQAVVLSKSKFKEYEEAKRWCADHEFKIDKFEETETDWVFEQMTVKSCDTETIKALDITDGVKTIICRLAGSSDGKSINVPVAVFKAVTATLAELQALRIAFDKLKEKATAPTQVVRGKDGEIKGREQGLAILRQALKQVDKAVGLALRESKQYEENSSKR